MSKEKQTDNAAELRRQAEEKARNRPAGEPPDLAALQPAEIRRMIHELRVHQIELEMQNEELRRAQAELDAARARYFDLYDLAPVGYFTVSEQGVVLEANLTAAGLWGVTRGALVRQRLTSFILKEDQDIYYRHRKALFESGKPQSCELRMMKPDGATFWAHLTATAAREGDGETVCRITIQDFTESKMAEAALREGEERRRFTLESCHIGTWDVDLADHSAVRSLEHARIFGYEKPQPIWSLEIFLEHVLPDDRVTARETIQRSIQTPSDFSFECRIRQVDGHIRWIWVAGRCRVDAGGQARNLSGVVQDITERKLHQAEIERISRLYATMSQINQTIVRVNSHEELTREVARIAVEFGGFKIAWVGRYNPQTRDVAPLGWAGEPWEVIRNFRHSLADAAETRCLCVPVIRENRSRVLNDLSSSPEMSEWLSVVEQAGIRSAAVFPIRVRGSVWGVFGVYESDPNVFQDKEIAMLEEAAMDIGYAIEHIDNEAQRRQAEDALWKSQEKYRRIIETANEGIWSMDGQFRTTYVNQHMADMLGYRIEEMLGKQVDSFMFPEDIADHSNKMSMRQSGMGGSYERRFVSKNGSAVWTIVSATALMNEQGVFAGSFGMFTDITDRKRAEMALRESEVRFRSLIEGAPEAIFVHCGGTFQYVNRAMVELVGAARAEDLLGRSFLDYVAAEFHEVICQHIRTERDARAVAPPKEQEFLHQDGRRVPVETTAVAIRFQGQDGHLVFVRDTTIRREAEKERANLEAQLRQAQKMESVGRLAGGVAHDFNNMLSIILGHTDMLLEQMDPANPVYADLTEIKKAGERSADLTRQLLAFARKQTVVPKVIDLNKTLAGMAKMLKRLIGEDIDMEWIAGEKVWPVKIDPGQIDQMLANLCVNARDAIAGVGKVIIQTGNSVFNEADCLDHAGLVPGEYVLLAVSDNGCGMDSEMMSHLFEPFFTTKELGKGTGLGLATVYGVVKQNNGFIDVSSQPGLGTTFKIYLPRHLARTVSVPGNGVDKPGGRGHETVLLVEDEPAILRMTMRMLAQEGYTVVAAGTPGEAIRLANQHAGDIHLLVSDVVMPEMNGRDLAKNILSLYPHLKCLFMSGYTTNVIAHHGVIDAGVNFIEKPFSKGDLAVKVREVLDRDTRL